MVKKRALTLAPKTLYRDIRAVLESARSSAYRAVNTAMVHAYWQVGRLIVEHEQGSRKRAAYGLAVLDDLARRLTADFGKGFTTTNLRYMRSFYQAFSIHHALRDESRSADNEIAPRSELPEVRPKVETLWLSSNQIATLFGSYKSFISRYLRNIFAAAERPREPAVAFFATVQRPAAGGHR